MKRTDTNYRDVPGRAGPGRVTDKTGPGKQHRAGYYFQPGGAGPGKKKKPGQVSKTGPGSDKKRAGSSGPGNRYQKACLVITVCAK